MDHNCLTYWGNQVAALVARLDQGYDDPKKGGAAWATRLKPKDDYDALLRLKDRLLAARDLKIDKLPDWNKKETIRVAGLLEAAYNVIGGLEGDRQSATPGLHDGDAKWWHATGDPDPDSSDRMANVLWPKVRKALGG